jgi:uncharacterized membrane protein
MKRRILNLVYNILVETGIFLLLFVPFFDHRNIFDVMQNVKLQYVSVLGAIYLIVLLWSFAYAVLAWLARNIEKEDSCTQKSLALFVVASVCLLGFSTITSKKVFLAIPLIVSFFAVLTYQLIAGKDE